ncbi:glutaredoxin [Babesia ovis]|uniref:Glutaredoxin n=1 Tax=Babesia ovis TaxID=5869 RepID=A0A9W5T9P6_BABOV|nr:glutaredoxin [Babesia ovis]
MEHGDIAKWVGECLQKSKIVVFSRSTCPYCVKANGILMSEAPDDLTIVQLDDNPNRPSIMEYFKETTGAATVPRVFIGGKFYGDCSKTAAAHESGELRKILEDAGCKLA